MTDSELRALVREAVARHFSGSAPKPPAALVAAAELRSSNFEVRSVAQTDPSHAMYVTLVNVGDACLIEPAVTCNHCGYCKSHGH